MSFYIIVSFVIAWAIAQLVKVGIEVVKNKGKVTLKQIVAKIVASGGMPSGHTASFMGAATATGCFLGVDSAEFGLAVCVLFVFVYDALNVRQAVGQQGKMLNRMVGLFDGEKKKGELKILRVVEGHTLPEVIVGAIIGVVTGVAVFLVCGAA